MEYLIQIVEKTFTNLGVGVVYFYEGKRHGTVAALIDFFYMRK